MRRPGPVCASGQPRSGGRGARGAPRVSRPGGGASPPWPSRNAARRGPARVRQRGRPGRWSTASACSRQELRRSSICSARLRGRSGRWSPRRPRRAERRPRRRPQGAPVAKAAEAALVRRRSAAARAGTPVRVARGTRAAAWARAVGGAPGGLRALAARAWRPAPRCRWRRAGQHAGVASVTSPCRPGVQRLGHLERGGVAGLGLARQAHADGAVQLRRHLGPVHRDRLDRLLLLLERQLGERRVLVRQPARPGTGRRTRPASRCPTAARPPRRGPARARGRRRCPAPSRPG